MKPITYVVVVALLVGFAGAYIEAADRDRDLPPRLWAGMKDSREKLRSGKFRARGRMIDEHPKVSRLEGDVGVFCAFDADRGRFRFDRTEPERMLRELNPKEKTDWTMMIMGGKYARTEGHSVVSLHSWKGVAIYPENKRPPRQIKPFDVRTISLATWADLERNESFPKLFEVYSRLVADELKEEENGIVRLMFKSNAGGVPVTYVLRIDQNAGCSPVRFEVDYWPFDKQKRPKILSETAWIKVNDVWVPKTYKIETRPQESVFRAYDLSFDWESTNGALDDDLFTERGFDLEPGTPILDRRGGKPILVGKIGEPMQ